MGERLELDALLKSILGTPFTYFQPPETVKMHYPCIRYELSTYDVAHADNGKYKTKKRYAVTYIDTNPDSLIPDQLLKLPYCSFSRFYKAANLNHWVFDLYY